MGVGACLLKPSYNIHILKVSFALSSNYLTLWMTLFWYIPKWTCWLMFRTFPPTFFFLHCFVPSRMNEAGDGKRCNTSLEMYWWPSEILECFYHPVNLTMHQLYLFSVLCFNHSEGETLCKCSVCVCGVCVWVCKYCKKYWENKVLLYSKPEHLCVRGLN